MVCQGENKTVQTCLFNPLIVRSLNKLEIETTKIIARILLRNIIINYDIYFDLVINNLKTF